MQAAHFYLVTISFSPLIGPYCHAGTVM